MVDGKSEIDDKNFFLAKNGDIDAQSELFATIDAFLNDKTQDDNSTVCRYPARYRWLSEKLDAKDFQTASCKDYNKIKNRVDPKSVTYIFPSAHINSPASMFGHTFLRINSSYNSKLLSYAVNYSANANTETENGFIFAIKGLLGGYYGQYSLLPYYEKLKEYRDSEQRDIWEYDLNLTQDETIRMFEHIWELNNIHSYYYFFTENCSYNMLWLLEIARPSLHLREHFTYQVSPLETIKAAQKDKLISGMNYRASKRTVLLKYETLLDDKHISLPVEIVDENLSISKALSNTDKAQKIYILESSIEYLEYQYGKSKVNKEKYLELFHNLTTSRAKLGVGKDLNIKTPPNPINSHSAARMSFGIGARDSELLSFIGVRPVYHDLEDSSYGLLRGTQIEFMNMLASYNNKNEFKVEDLTLVSITSLAQRSEFFKVFSWRTKFGWDRDNLSDSTDFSATVGAGYSWGNKYGYIYMLLEPIIYFNKNFDAALGGTIGLNIDKYKMFNTNMLLTQRFYADSKKQLHIKISEGIRTSINTQVMLKYEYKDRYIQDKYTDETTLGLFFKWYF
jgi:hypothetical protein